MLQQYTATITTDGDGAATVYIGSSVRGYIQAIKYEPGTLSSANLTLIGETSEIPILAKTGAGTSTVWYYPRAAANLNSSGAAITDSAEPIFLYLERMKLTVASGGATKTGTITVWVDEEV